jgi:hypothetical protein
VGAKHVANIITPIVIYYYYIYYNTEFKFPEISIFRNNAVTNIRKYQTCAIQICTVGQYCVKTLTLHSAEVQIGKEKGLLSYEADKSEN